MSNKSKRRGGGTGGTGGTGVASSDPESHRASLTQQQQQQQINNPYSPSPSSSGGMLSPYHPINVLKRTLYITLAVYGLHHLEAFTSILHSPRIRHEWFKIGLAGSILILIIKAYVELYAGKQLKQKVNYDNFRQTTHVVLALLVVTSFCFHVALWKHYGVTTLLVLFLVGTVLLNVCLLMPTYMQNLVAVFVMTFFLQEYK